MSQSATRRARHAASATEVPSSEVKNAWHEYLDRVSRGNEEIVVTRYGKPIARLAPMQDPGTTPRIFGILAGTVTVVGDLVAPTGEAWEADA